MSADDPGRYNRRSLRLPGWDYRSAAVYFITVCTYQREHLFADPNMLDIASNGLLALPNQVERAVIDEWAIMPDHLHCLLALTDDSTKSLPVEPVDTHWVTVEEAPDTRLLTNAPAGSLGSIIRSYKAAVTRKINTRRQTPGARVWQRGYYERIVRNAEELERIRAYIQNNPARWATTDDQLNRLLTRMSLRK